MLDLGDFVNVLQRDGAADLVARVHGPAQAALPGLDVGGVQQEIGGGRGADVEVEGSVRADGDARRDGDAGVDVGCAGIEFLASSQYPRARQGGPSPKLTLQKSMLLTPLLPSAGPTGGLGEAWPAPTMSLTNCSFCKAFLAMMEGG